MGRHGAPSASLGSGSARAPPEAGQVRATRRSDAIPRPRAGCPATSAAGLSMTVKRDARGQHELRCPGLLPSRSLPALVRRVGLHARVGSPVALCAHLGASRATPAGAPLRHAAMASQGPTTG